MSLLQGLSFTCRWALGCTHFTKAIQISLPPAYEIPSLLPIRNVQIVLALNINYLLFNILFPFFFFFSSQLRLSNEKPTTLAGTDLKHTVSRLIHHGRPFIKSKQHTLINNNAGPRAGVSCARMKVAQGLSWKAMPKGLQKSWLLLGGEEQSLLCHPSSVPMGSKNCPLSAIPFSLSHG